ncbi:MAG: ATP-dependent Clp protease ATP-binding subunit ClpA [Bartonella clarridgeiae]|nr:MAG: ATP-dependent Clp protease ATP-binding subunit ClpA [Bartonella clarridgeiae]
MDYGKLTDHNGKKIDCCSILIMIANVDTSDVIKSAIGFIKYIAMMII